MNGKQREECLPEMLAKRESSKGIEDRKYAGD
jgi:hypothetical protein